MNSNISDKDRKDWEKFITSTDKLLNKDKEKKFKTLLATKSIDLHGLTLDKANFVIEEFITKSFNEGVSKLIVVTGKGIHSKNEQDPYVSKDFGILKNSVPEYIKNNNRLMSKINDIVDADIKDGGSGAFYIYLKKKL